MKDYKLYVFDMDGVLYRGKEVVPGAQQAIIDLQDKGKFIRYLTNNSTQTRRLFADSLLDMGFEVRPEHIYTSAAGAAIYLRNSSAYVVGEDGLREELRAMDVRIAEREDPADWVVAGACWTFNYAMLDEAQWRIRNGAHFLATNPAKTFPVENGRVRPGAGAIVAAIAAAAEREPDVMIGKPEPTLVRMILAETEARENETLLIGDRLDTDIACATRVPCDSALVLTGVTSAKDLRNSSLKPTFMIESVAELAG